MYLTKFTYRDADWEVADLMFMDRSLIVAQNAVGKSRTFKVINQFSQVISQKQTPPSGGSWEAEFMTGTNDIIRIEFTCSAKQTKFLRERIFLNDELVLSRSNRDNVKILNVLSGVPEEATPPEDKLAIHALRDTRKFPYLEDIANWADNFHSVKFSDLNPNFVWNLHRSESFSLLENFPNLFKKLSPSSKEKVLAEMNILGYPVEKIQYFGNGRFSLLEVKEVGLSKSNNHLEISQGMFRSLAVIIFLEHLISQLKPSILTIDDFCEGLDYSRASKLGKLVFDKCANSKVQLIATSNDSFLMDAIDIKYWNILRRNGKKVTALNIQNNEELFNNFRFTGLSNFDLLSSDYLIAKSQ